MYSKINSILRDNTHHDITKLEVEGMGKNIQN